LLRTNKGHNLKVLIVDGLEAVQEHLLISKNVRVKFVTCGRPNCRCRLGERHGPYYYIRKKIGNKHKDIYVKAPRKLISLKYEAIGSSILLHVDSLDEVPDFLQGRSIFLVQKMVKQTS